MLISALSLGRRAGCKAQYVAKSGSVSSTPGCAAAVSFLTGRVVSVWVVELHEIGSKSAAFDSTAWHMQIACMTVAKEYICNINVQLSTKISRAPAFEQVQHAAHVTVIARHAMHQQHPAKLPMLE